MSETEQQIREREYEANLQKLQDLRPIDDEFMRCMILTVQMLMICILG